jgi:hypothetical protein
MRLRSGVPRARAVAAALVLVAGCAGVVRIEAFSQASTGRARSAGAGSVSQEQPASQRDAGARAEAGPREVPQAGKALALMALRGSADLGDLSSAGVPVYARLASAGGSAVLVGVDAAATALLASEGHDLLTLDPSIDGARYYVVYFTPPFPRARGRELPANGRLLYENETYAVMRMSAKNARSLAEAGAGLRAVTLDPKPLPAAVPPTRCYPQSISADPVIQGLIDQVEASAVYQYTGDLSGEWPVTVGGLTDTIKTRHTYGAYIQMATDYAGERMEALGLSVEYMQWDAPGYPNVIGELPGSVSPDTIIIICGHIDDMPPGPIAPGADDNASGATAVLLAADVMSRYSWGYTLRFALWTGEEQGLLGSHAYAQRSSGLGENIAGVLNLDMIAYNTSGSARDIDLHANSGIPATLELAQLFADAVGVYGLDLIPQIVPDGTGASDHTSFCDYGYAAILGIEDLGDFNPRLHKTTDRLEYLDMDYYVEFVRASIAACAHMAGVRAEERQVPALARTGSILLTLLLAVLGLGSIRMRL